MGQKVVKHFCKGLKQELMASHRNGMINLVKAPLVLAICTPLMPRAHVLLQQAGELVHCDSTASLDRCNCPTFIMSTACSAGGIPVGVVITSGEAEVFHT